ncbi:putative reverse transcriptase domain-containing protein [Tanacetum coccineum]
MLDASPTADSPGYVPESDPEEEPKEDPADYPADRDDDDDDDCRTRMRRRTVRSTSPADFCPTIHRMTAKISIRDEPSIIPLRKSLLSSDYKTDRPEITLPPRKRLGIDLGPRHEIGESLAAAATRPVGGRRQTMDPREAVEEVASMTLGGVNTRVTELTAVQEQDTQDIYAVIEDTQDRQTPDYIRSCWGHWLIDSQYPLYVARLLDQEALVSREAWGRSIEAADRKSQVVTLEMLQAGLPGQKMAPKRKTTRLNPDATPTPVTDTHTTTSVTNAQIQAMINEGVTAALAARDATRNGDDSHTSGTGVRRPVQVARECTYPDFLKCQPLNFKGTEGVVRLTQWFEKMESVYSISNCTVACQVKFATCTLQGNALTWWNSHVKTTTPEAAHAMPWRTLKKMMTDKYCPRGEIKKLEFEMWNLKVKGNDVVAYSQRFQELALMCDRMFPEEIDQVKKYVGGLPDTIHGSVMATKPKTMQDAIEFATELMDKKINTWAERQADNKRKSDDTARNNQNQQPNKRQNTGRAYAAGNGDRRPYGGPKPLCSKCNYHHEGPCAPKCHKCNRFGHVSRDCRSPPNVNTGANQRACFECGAQGHFKKDCPKLKNNNNRGNQAGNAKAQAKVYAVGNAGANPDNNIVTGTLTPSTIKLTSILYKSYSHEQDTSLSLLGIAIKLAAQKNYADVGPFKVLEQVESVAYKLKLPQELSRVYNMFHVSNLKKYYPDDPLVVPLEGLHVDEKLHFVEKPVEIMD